MEKERKIKILSIIALIVSVLGLTVAFAALSQTLTINGSASVDAATWDIHFANLQAPEITGDASVTTPLVLESTTISNFNVSVTKPGDKIVYTFDIVNNGTINAVIDNFNEMQLYIYKVIANQDLTYDLNGDGYVTVDDLKSLLSMIKVGLYYEDEVTKVKQGDPLNAGDTKKVKLIVEYKEESNKLPSGPIKIFDNATTTIDYVQAD